MMTIITVIQEFIMTYPITSILLMFCLASFFIMFIKDRDTRKASYETLFLLAFVLTFMMLLETPFVINVLNVFMNGIYNALTHPIVYDTLEDLFTMVSMFFSLYPNLWWVLLLLGNGLFIFGTVFKHEQDNNYPQGIMVAILKAAFAMVLTSLISLILLYFYYSL